MNIPQLLTFTILMQSGEGILGVAPPYLMEKYEDVKRYPHPEFLLDTQNRAIYEAWMDRWSFNTIGD